MSISSAMRSAASGMTAERFRMDVISSNIANANSMQVKGGPEAYRRRDVVLQGDVDGVKIVGVVQDPLEQHPYRKIYDPGNPNADQGYVTYTNVEPVYEMVNMMSASRAYEANVAAFNSGKAMMRSALNIGKV